MTNTTIHIKKTNLPAKEYTITARVAPCDDVCGALITASRALVDQAHEISEGRGL